MLSRDAIQRRSCPVIYATYCLEEPGYVLQAFLYEYDVVCVRNRATEKTLKTVKVTYIQITLFWLNYTHKFNS